MLVTTPGLDPRLRVPLSEVNRKERIYLLSVSMVGITIVYTGLIPSEFTTLGIKFRESLATISSMREYASLSFPVHTAEKGGPQRDLPVSAYLQGGARRIAQRSYSSCIESRIFGAELLFRGV